MTEGGTDNKHVTRIVVVAIVGLAFLGLAALMGNSKSSLFADESPVPSYADANQ